MSQFRKELYKIDLEEVTIENIVDYIISIKLRERENKKVEGSNV